MVNETLVVQWLRFARMDLDLARHTIETMYPPPLEIICYHCQQAAEKYLKGLLAGQTHYKDIRNNYPPKYSIKKPAKALESLGVEK